MQLTTITASLLLIISKAFSETISTKGEVQTIPPPALKGSQFISKEDAIALLAGDAPRELAGDDGGNGGMAISDWTAYTMMPLRCVRWKEKYDVVMYTLHADSYEDNR